LLVKTPLVTSTTMAAISPGPRTIDAALTAMVTSLRRALPGGPPEQLPHRSRQI
jgi:hypothetical protein